MINVPLIEVQDLHVRFGAQAAPTLKGISFELQAGECLALVGESGSGKSVTSRTLAGLTGANAIIQARRLAFAGRDLRQFDERSWRQVRGAQIGFVMQDALGSLDPLRPVGKEIVDLNNRGVMAARSGDLEGAVKLLIQAAEQVPNLQFLVNAAKAIYTLMDQKGWDAELAARALDYLQRAQRKDRKSPKVASARHLYVTVAKKYGITTDNA